MERQAAHCVEKASRLGLIPCPGVLTGFPGTRHWRCCLLGRIFEQDALTHIPQGYGNRNFRATKLEYRSPTAFLLCGLPVAALAVLAGIPVGRALDQVSPRLALTYGAMQIAPCRFAWAQGSKGLSMAAFAPVRRGFGDCSLTRKPPSTGTNFSHGSRR